MTCVFCREVYENFWHEVEKWERNNAYYWELFDEEPDCDALLAANRKFSSDPAAAFANYRQLADHGSILALEYLAQCYEHGHGVETDRDLAIQNYLAAMKGGSWTAVLSYSHFLAHRGRWNECFKVLEDAVSAQIYPAFFWLAWRLHQRGTDGEGYRRIGQLLDAAEEAGHPAALVYQSRFLLTGKFGLLKMPLGVVKMWQHISQRLTADDRADSQATQPAE